MIFKAILSSQASLGYGQATIHFPIPDSDYDLVIRMLEDIGVGSPTAQDCRVVGLEGLYPTLKRLNGQAINVDELDYLAKRLDSFSDGEDAQFEAMAFKLNLSSIKDFINLTFCCRQATVITNFSDLELAGSGGAGFHLSMITDDLPPQVSAAVSLTGDSLDEINGLCRAIKPLNAEQREKLGAVALLARPQYASEARKLAENLDQFDFMARPLTQETGIALTELGCVAYHGSVTLEELMRDNPAEQHQQEMGGLA